MVALVMSWEWAHVVRSVTFDLALVIHGLAVAAAIALATFGFAALGVAVLIIGAIIVAGAGVRQSARSSPPQAFSMPACRPSRSSG